MTYLGRCFLRMVIFLGIAGGGVAMLYRSLFTAFSHNPALNGVIFATLLFGIVLAFFQLYRLNKEQSWLDTYDQGEERFPGAPKAKIIAPLVILLSDSRDLTSISTLTAKSVLSSIEGRLDETRDISRYLTGLLIFLGLLGTFWGLSQTISAIAGVVTGIDVGSADTKDVFQNLKQGLQSPLSGMGTAFSSSMFGLAGSLILGFLDLQMTKAASVFYHSLEERLALVTRTSGSISDNSAQGGSGVAYVQGLLEQTVEGMGALQALMRRNEDSRVSVVKSLHSFSEKLSLMAEHTISHQNLIKKIAQNQIDLQENLVKVTSQVTHNLQDDTIKQHMRSLDATSLRVLEELIEGRARTTQEIKAEIRLVARTLSALANGQEVAA